MKRINAAQLAWIMQIPKKDAVCKILVCLEKEPAEPKNPSIELKKLSDKMGIDFDFFIKDINKNFLKNQATGSYILKYPQTKLKPSKKDWINAKAYFYSVCIEKLLI
jgi:hypothetical protein